MSREFTETEYDELCQKWFISGYEAGRKDGDVKTRMELVAVLQDMDRTQQQTDEDGGREIAWYYWREGIEDILNIPHGTLDRSKDIEYGT